MAKKIVSKEVTLDGMSIAEIKALEAKLMNAKKERQDKFEKGELLTDEITLNKGNGLILRFKGSRFPINAWPSQLREIFKHKKLLEKTMAELGVE